MSGFLHVQSPVAGEAWQPVAYARQLMLMHSFSFLPVRLNGEWCLVSELGLAKYLSGGSRRTLLCQTIEAAKISGMKVVKVPDNELLHAQMKVDEVLSRAKVQQGPTLWLVVDCARHDHLAGVLSPFELM